MQDVQETKAEKVKNRAIETGEGSGENKKGMICAELEMSTLAYACSHRCFCSVCGTRESCIHGLVPTNDAKAHMPAWLGQNAHFQRTADHALFLLPTTFPRLSSSSLHLFGLSFMNILQCYYLCFSLCVCVLFRTLVSTKEATFCSSAGATKAPLVAQAPAPCLLTEGCCLHFTRYCIFCPREVLIQKILHIFLKCNVQLSNFHNLLVFSIQFLWDRVLTLSTRWWTASLCFSSNSILNILLCMDIMT